MVTPVRGVRARGGVVLRVRVEQVGCRGGVGTVRAQQLCRHGGGVDAVALECGGEAVQVVAGFKAGREG